MNKPNKTSLTPSSDTIESSGSFARARAAIAHHFRKRHIKYYKDRYFHLWADLLLAGLLAGALISLVWLLLWQPKPDFLLEARLMNSHVLSGQSNEFVIRYANQQKSPVGGVAIKLELPKDFVLESAEPAASFDRNAGTFNLGDLEGGEGGELKIRGLVRGPINDRQFFGLTMTYRNGQLRRQLLASTGYQIDGSVIDLGLQLPERVYANVDFTGNLSVKNTGSAKIEGLQLLFPELDLEVSGAGLVNNRLTLNLEPGETKDIEFTGRERSEGNKELLVEAGLDIGQAYVKQAQVNGTLHVDKPGLTVNASIREGSLSASNTVATLDLEAANLSAENISNIALAVSGRGKTRIKSLALVGEGTVRGTTVYVSGNLAPAARLKTVVRVEIERDEVVFNDTVSFAIKVNYESQGQEVEYSLSTERAPVSTNLTLHSDGYYYGPQGDQLGVGPIPPRVDIPTTYWIVWQLNNLGNDVNALEVSADLPAAVIWADQQSLTAGDITYSPVTKRVLWKPGTVTKNGGNYRASFAVTIIPTSADIGTIPVLLKNVHYTGSDAYTKQLLTRSSPDITAALPSDSRSSGKGKVEAQ